MTVFIIPTSKAPFRRQRTRLDGVDYLLSFVYNQREDRIYLSLADDEELPIVSGIKILANYPLLWRHRHDPKIPPGELMAIDTTSDGSPPGLGELGEGLRCQLTYLDSLELAAFRPAPPPLPIAVAMFVAVRITVASRYIGHSNFATEFAAALVQACAGTFGVGSMVTAAGLAALAGPYGTITGCDVGLIAPPVGPTTIASTTITIEPNQYPSFDVSRISVVAV